MAHVWPLWRQNLTDMAPRLFSRRENRPQKNTDSGPQKNTDKHREREFSLPNPGILAVFFCVFLWLIIGGLCFSCGVSLRLPSQRDQRIDSWPGVPKVTRREADQGDGRHDGDERQRIVLRRGKQLRGDQARRRKTRKQANRCARGSRRRPMNPTIRRTCTGAAPGAIRIPISCVCCETV
jgi:hypothetical protein